MALSVSVLHICFVDLRKKYNGVFFGHQVLYMDNIPTWLAVTVSIALGLLVAILTHLVIVPMQKRKIAKQLRVKNPVKFQFEDSVGEFGSKKNCYFL